MFHKDFYRSGVTLIETMVALVVLGVIGVTLIRLMVSIESANNSAKTRNQAINLSEQALEQVRGLVQTPGFGWGGLNTLAGTISFGTYPACSSNAYTDGTLRGCVSTAGANICTITTVDSAGLTTPVSGSNGGNSTGFCQSVVLVKDITGIKVRSLIGWVEKGRNQYTEADSNFYNY